ncbi:MAG: zinc ABC transporter substrate-binding protein [Phycisphaerales bacterium]|nr:zinc ABC transporter substrate-binding protein [Phycisphaerales bacterium]
MRLSRINIVAALVVCVAFVSSGCNSETSGKSKGPYRITCTVGMITDIVRQVAGDKADVEGIIGEGVDPHLYQATRSDINKLMAADIVFYNGLMLEGKMADALVKVGRKRPVYAATEFVDKSRLLEPPEFDGHHDPHLWMDPTLWKKCAETIAKTLGEFDPANKSHYFKNYERYAQQIDKLHEYAQKSLSTIPEKSRVLVTAHDAFNYFARAYDLEVKGIQGISTESEAGLKDINQLVDLLVQRGIRAVFVESSVSDKNVKALVEGAAAKGGKVTIGGTLFSDAMGRPGSYEGTYIGMIDHNVTKITRALGGKAPQKGMQGKLSGG